jgi:hypothetical protein
MEFIVTGKLIFLWSILGGIYGWIMYAYRQLKKRKYWKECEACNIHIDIRKLTYILSAPDDTKVAFACKCGHVIKIDSDLIL